VTAFAALVVVVVAVILPGFASPTGNIRCAARTSQPAVLHCELGHADYAARLQARCTQGAGVDWHGFELTAVGRGQIACAGGSWHAGSEHPRYVTLPYGRTWKAGPFGCVSQPRGVTCHNPRGHGFFLSRERYRVF
jgi:hypothetical protein